MTKRTIVLSGPPAIGKSTLGRALGQALGCSFVDLDHEIASTTGIDVPTLIRTRGEAAFRKTECHVLQRLVDNTARIIALGGGTLTHAESRQTARRLGLQVGLSAPLSHLETRLAQGKNERPLLNQDSLAQLLQKRHTSYQAADVFVDASFDIPNTVTQIQTAVAELDHLECQVGTHQSRILFGTHLSQALRGTIAHLEPQRPVLCLEDQGAPAALREQYIEAIKTLAPVLRYPLPGGEAVKSWQTLGEVLEFALAHDCGRQSVVVGIGGGALCDLAAMVSSLLGRGAPLVLLPTTLLSQVDASVGGKCAINMGVGRNLVGQFYPANDVLIASEWLSSLSPQDLRGGAAETLKMGILFDPAFFRDMVELRQVQRQHIVRAVELKRDVVAEDPFEKNERKRLNLGHTLAHALESASDYSLSHGDAVAIGIAAIARFSANRSLLSAKDAQEIIRGLENFHLPTRAPAELLRRCAPYLRKDKKGDGAQIDLVLIAALGRSQIESMTWDVVENELVAFGG